MSSQVLDLHQLYVGGEAEHCMVAPFPYLIAIGDALVHTTWLQEYIHVIIHTTTRTATIKIEHSTSTYTMSRLYVLDCAF